MSIGYLAQKFPSLTTTFVYREVLALRRAGLRVETFSTWKPSLNELSDEAKDLVADTFYIFPLKPSRFLLSHLGYLLTRPRRYLGTLWFCLGRKHKTLKNRLRTLLHFGQAVYLAREIERSGIEHLHVHFALNATTIAMIVSRLTGTTFSFTAHANDIFVNPILLPEKIAAARFIIAISKYNIEVLHRAKPTPETLNKTFLVHCGIDVARFSPPAERPESDRPVILAVGRLVEKKGHEYLIRACRILAGRGYQFQCYIVGGGPEEVKLQRLIEDNALASYVSLEGAVFQEHLRDYMDKTSLFVLPCVVARDQDMDGIPNTLMEAMAMEIPTISTTISGIPELIEHNQSGLLVPPRDDVALANAIASLLDDPQLRQGLGQAGRRTVVEQFEIEQNSARLLEVFKTNLRDFVALGEK
jgi:colanic acid/amylovoran biosynthesis glycosyltransferase